jgi:hypothetical protein
MRKIPKPKANLYEVTLTHQIPHLDYQWRYYMDGDELHTTSKILRFQAVDLRHAKGLLSGTNYEGNIKRVR